MDMAKENGGDNCNDQYHRQPQAGNCNDNRDAADADKSHRG